MQELKIRTLRRDEMIDITDPILACIPPGMKSGLCHIYCPHTTAGLTINENADPDVRRDLLEKLDRLIPQNELYYQHAEGNSAAHLKSSLMGFSQMIPVQDGRLVLGTWQGIYLCEFDGPRSRCIYLSFLISEF